MALLMQDLAKVSALATEPDMTNWHRYLSSEWQLIEDGGNFLVAKFKGQLVLAFSATRLDQIRYAFGDAVTDAYIATGHTDNSPRKTEGVALYRKWSKVGPLILTGTSLGGRIADDIAQEQGCPSVVFNQGFSVLEYLDDDTNYSNTQHYNYHINGDVISASSLLLPNRHHIRLSPSVDDAHSIVNFWNLPGEIFH